MLDKLDRAAWQRDLARFLDTLVKGEESVLPYDQLEYFHPVQLPVVITEAQVRLRSVQDFSVLSLLILRLFDAGITSPEAIRDISGMSIQTVNSFIEKEVRVLEHIDPDTGELTELGKQTLEANRDLQDGVPRACQLYRSVLRVHVDPLTASLIPQYLEYELGDNILPNEEAGDFILPPQDAETDEDFLQELNTRLLTDINSRMEEHVSCDAVKNGNILDSIDRFDPIRVFFRWGYLARFEDMTYPMIVFTGKRTLDKINDRSKAAGEHGMFVASPVAIARSDMELLRSKGIVFENVITRSDSCFLQLLEIAEDMDLSLPEMDAEGSEERVDE